MRGVVAQVTGDWRLETGDWKLAGAAAADASPLRLEAGGWKLGATLQVALHCCRLERGWGLDAGYWRLEAWRCGCFDEAVDWRLETGC